METLRYFQQVIVVLQSDIYLSGLVPSRSLFDDHGQNLLVSCHEI